MIRILIADDHTIVRQGLKQIVAEEPDLLVAGEADSAAQVLTLVNNQAWDVIVLDISMPGRNGLEALKEIKKAYPRLPVLVLSMHPEDQFAVRVLKAGAAGYLTKESAPEELIKAIRKVATGGKYISQTVAEKLAFNLTGDTERPLHDLLSDREYQVLLLLASGKTVSEVAAELALSVKTISTYRTRILAKMHLQTTAQLTHYVIQNHLLGD